MADKLMTNYSILQLNISNSLVSEEGKMAFFWACDRIEADPRLYRAEAFAREVELLAEAIPNMLGLAAAGFQELAGAADLYDLTNFIMVRHSFYRHPDRSTSWKLRGERVTRK